MSSPRYRASGAVAGRARCGGRAGVYLLSAHQPLRAAYTLIMPARPVGTSEEMCQMMRSAPPPTADDVWITRDGRRLDTAEKILEHIGQLNAELAAEDRAWQGNGFAA